MRVASLGFALLLALAISPAHTQSWPERTITLVNPFPPGASTDQVSRLIQPKLQAALGQTIVDRLNAELKKILSDPDITKRLEDLTFQVIADSPESLTERIRTEHAMWGDVVKASTKSN